MYRMEAVLVLEMSPKHSVLFLPFFFVKVTSVLGAGADYVMLGGMLAGHDQSGGQIIEQNGKKFKLFYGMSSSTAMEKYHGEVKDYR